MRKLREGEINPYYNRYAELVPEGELLQLLSYTHNDTQKILEDVAEEKGDYRYEEGKWSLKEVLIHMIDTEHIFGCRALRIAREDQTPLPSFDQNEFVNGVNVSNRTIKDLLEEFYAMRQLTIAMFRHFDDEMMERMGNMSGGRASVTGIAYIILGHELHHMNIIKERYLK